MLYGNVAGKCIEVIREICSANYVDIISGNISPDHIHMLISVPPHLSVSKVIQYIKGKSSRKLQKEFQKLRKRYWGQHLWARGHFVATSGQISAKEVQKYIEEQEAHHKQDNFRISES